MKDVVLILLAAILAIVLVFLNIAATDKGFKWSFDGVHHTLTLGDK